MSTRGSESAYPLANSEAGNWDVCGMTIREAFAMAAMQGFCANGNLPRHVVADEAVRHADALLAALNAARESTQ